METLTSFAVLESMDRELELLCNWSPKVRSNLVGVSSLLSSSRAPPLHRMQLLHEHIEEGCSI